MDITKPPSPRGHKLQEDKQRHEDLEQPGDSWMIHESKTHTMEYVIEDNEKISTTTRLQVQEAGQKYFDIFNLAPVGYLTLDPEGNIIEANLHGAALLGRDALRGQSLIDFLEAGYYPFFIEKLHELFLDAKPFCVELVFNVENRIVYTEARAVPGRENGKPVCRMVLNDISGYKNAVRELRENREQLQLLAKVVADTHNAVIVMDQQYHITWVNDGFTRITGYTLDEVFGQTLAAQLYGTATAQDTSASVSEALQARRPVNVELINYHKSGRLFWIRIAIEPLFDDNNRHLGFIAMASDITQRKKAELALQETERYYRNLFENAPVMYVIAEIKNNTAYIAECNSLFLKILDYKENEVVDCVLSDFYSEKSRLFMNPARCREILNTRILGREHELVARDGRIVHTVMHLVVDRNDNEVPIRLRVIFIDISPRVRIEQALQRRLAMERLIGELSARFLSPAYDGLDHLFAHALRRIGTFLGVDSCYLRLVSEDGHSLNLEHVWEIAGRPRQPHNLPITAIPWHLKELGSGVIVRVADSTRLPPQAEAEREFYQKRHIGAALYAPLLYDGKLLGFIAVEIAHLSHTWIEEEITLLRLAAEIFTGALQRRQAEEQLRAFNESLEQRVMNRTEELMVANLELAKASRLKDEFLASMSHELRTPLTVILGITDVLQEGIYGVLNEKQQEAIINADQSGRHLLRLINDILDLSKVEAGQMDFHPTLCKVEEICSDSLKFVNQMAFKKKQQLSFDLCPENPAILADPLRLKQMLVNLLSNAVKFTPCGGRLGLEVWGDPGAQSLYFKVWDHGIGIPAEKLPNIFKPFLQLDTGLQREYPGAGLGLALVKRMCEMHNGTLSVESDVHRGSCFILELPWHGETVDQLENLRQPRANGIGYNDIPATISTGALILLAEDIEPTINTVRDYLESKGYRVAVARNGEEALQKTKTLRPALIVMDIQMPKTDGLAAIREIRQGPQPLASVPIIALTAMAMKGDRERCLQAGADDYLSKPMRMRQLLESMERLLAGR